MKLKDKFSIVILLLMVSFSTVSGQQDPLSTQYMFNPMNVNPSHIASVEQMSFTNISRLQWVGFEGSPSTQYLAGAFPIKRFNFTLGATLIHDVAGPEKQTAVFVDYGYSIKVNDASRLNFGLRGGIGNFHADLTNVSTTNDFDPSFITDIYNQLILNFGVGMTYTTNKYYVGYSIPKIFKNRFENGDFSATHISHHYFFGGTMINLNSDIDLYPSMMAKMVKGAPPSVDISASAIYKNKIGGGLMYRFGASIGIMVNFKIMNNFWMGYSYDMATTKMHYQNFGTHELMITYTPGSGGNLLNRLFLSPAE
jgi:type IX secretion system PorP/SprF family membrane protein